MKNNVMDKVQINNSRHPKARFNLSHDVNSSYQFGEVQPVICKQMIPEEKDVVSINSLVRLAPMVAPTFGRIKHKEWHHFVPMTDLFPHFGNFMAGTSYDFKYPLSLPCMKLGLLSYMCLIGAKFTIYAPDVAGAQDLAVSTKYLLKCSNVSTLSSSITNLLSRITPNNELYPFGWDANFSSPDFNTSVGNKINLKYLIPPQLVGANYTISNLVDINVPCANFNGNSSWFDIVDKNVSGTQYSRVTDLDTVSLDSADAVLPWLYSYTDQGQSNSGLLFLACRFSNFGKRLYKILIGCGYQLDFTSTENVSLMPLFAFYKAWFDSFGLTRYNSWKDTSAYHILFTYDKENAYDLNLVFDSSNTTSQLLTYWFRFIVELGNCFVTEDVDFVSSHLAQSPSFTPTIGYGLDSMVVKNSGTTLNSQSSSSVVVSTGITKNDNTVSLGVQSFKLSALDVKELMSLYRWCNRNTIAGREIEKLLRAQGYGYFLYSCKSNFIGYTEQNVQIYDVVNSSDTYDSASGQGMLLGDYAGRGIGYEESKTLTFEADEHGYWIGLCAIVPESGYSQGLDPSVRAISKLQMYNPEFDGLGYELNPKSSVCASVPFSTLFSDGDKLKSGFGLLPTYSSLKIARNISNGGFSLRSGKRIFAPYMLDKIMDVGERSIFLQSENNSQAVYTVIKSFAPGDFPIAGDWWRFVNRYPWLGNFDRIFAQQVHNSDLLNQINTLIDNSGYEYVTYSDDNFLVHHVVNQQAFANMLPIDATFGTDDDGSMNDSIEQA